MNNRKAAPPVYKLNDYQRNSACRTLILKLGIITGWSVPQAEALKYLTEQFEKKLLESYPNLNVVEIEYAFRSKATEIKDWGKELNLSLITEVLNAYLYDTKESVQKALELPENEPQRHIYSDEDYKNERRAEIERFYQLKREGKKNPLWLACWEEVMVEDGIINSPAQKDAFFENCLKKGLKNIYQLIK